jgi:serine/threonine-protein kinase
VDALNESEGSDARIGSLVDERYTILEAMASGSMGAVYKAERVPVGKLVAIKFLHSSYAKDSEFLARFERETRVMSKLTHPNCVSVVDFGVWEGAPYLVMEYVAGTTLRELMDAGPMPAQRALVLARQIAAGLAHAHAQGIVHRDVKPANIMISEEIGTGDHVRILDFGLARLRGAVGRDATQNNVVVGTPNYMAPEQTIGGGTIDARTDVYAVGVVLFEMLAGERPFTSEDTMSLLGMHRAAPIPRIADRIKDGVVLPDGIQELLDKAMAKLPDARFQSAIELAEAIDEVSGARVAREYRSVPVKRLTTNPEAVAPTMLDVTRQDVAPRALTAAKPARGGWDSWFGSLVFVLLLAGVAGGAYWFFKLRGGDATTPATTPVAATTPAAATDAGGAGSGEGRVASAAIDAGSPVAVDAPLGADAAEAVANTGAGAGSGTGSAADEIEMDPASATNPDPGGDTVAEDEAAGAPSTAEEVEKQPAPAPALATTLPAAIQLIKDGKRDVALASLQALWKKSPNSSYIPFLLGNLYYDQRWWGVAMDYYKAAISKNAAYKGNQTLNRNVIRMMASPKTVNRARSFLRTTIGRPAVPYLKSAAKTEANPNVRKLAASLAKQIR